MARDKWNEWAWLIKTAKGDFFITVIGNWTQEEAAQKLSFVFETLKLGIIGMIPRERPSGPDENQGTIHEQLEPKDVLGFDFMAGKKLWEVCGRGVEYEAELVALEKQMKEYL